MIKLRTDNATPPLMVEVSANELTRAIKTVLRWRTSKGYNNIIERYKNCGSINYDRVIKYLYKNKGWL